MRELIREHHLRPVVFHSLRHSSTSVKLRISGGDIKAVQGDTGHAQANMVTDVYGHIMNDDRRQLAQQMDAQFFCAPVESRPEKEKAAAQSSRNESMEKLIRLMEASPEIIEPILKMGEIMSGKDKEQQ